MEDITYCGVIACRRITGHHYLEVIEQCQIGSARKGGILISRILVMVLPVGLFVV